MSSVMIIPAKRNVGNNVRNSEAPKLRVAAYCRVSTDSDEQETSYETQVNHYTDYIKRNPEWNFAGIYADDGISGTNTKKREEFNRMIADCMAGNIDMVITKSISRFARNTLDCLKYIRQLKDKNISVYFEKEAINTMDAKGEVLLTIMASLAQQESQSLSQNVKLGMQYRFQQGKVMVNCARFLGYEKSTDGVLVIVPEEAEIIKRIYSEFLDGLSTNKIKKGLEADGILTGAGETKWYTSTIYTILKNEKYMGDALLQKTYTTDFLSRTRVKNKGIMPQYYVEDNHEAIIPKDIFMRVQEELLRRRAVHVGPSGKKRGFSCNNCFSQIVLCGECGELYRRVHWYPRGVTSIVWRCISRLEPSSTAAPCSARTVSEDLLKDITVKAQNRILRDRGQFLNALQENIANAVLSTDTLSPEGIDVRLAELQEELIGKTHHGQGYDVVADEILVLREQKQKALSNGTNRSETLERIQELQEFIREQDTDVVEFDETLVRRLVKKVTVYKKKFTVEFKSGVSVDVRG